MTHTPLRRRLRMARRGLWYTVAVSLVLMALAAGVTSQLLPLAERHPDRIAEWLSARAGRPVAFDRVETAWTRRGPLLRLEGLRIGKGEEVIPVGEAEVLVSQYAGLLPGRSFTELRLRGLQLTLVRAADGRWTVRGLPGEQTGGDPLAALEGLGELQLVNASLGIDAPSLGIRTRVPEIDLRLQVDQAQLRAGARARMRAKDAPLHASFVLDRASGDGRFHASTENAALGGWSGLLHAFGVTVVGGQGDVRVWASLDNRQVTTVTAEVDLENVGLRGAPLQQDAGGSLPRVDFAALQATLFWRSRSDGWRLDAKRLRVQARRGDEAQRLDGLLVAGGQHYGLRAERIDAAPLIAVAALSDRLPANLRRWLSASRPQAVLERIEVAGLRAPEPAVAASATGSAATSGAITGTLDDASGGLAGLADPADPAASSVSVQTAPASVATVTDPPPAGAAAAEAAAGPAPDAFAGGTLRIGADMREVGFASVGGTPGITGLAGHLSGDGNGFVFAFDPESRARFDWPTGFGVPHPLRLGGEVVVWRAERGWRVETPALRIDGEGYGADARGGLWFEGDGSRPLIDLAVDVDDAQAVQAERLWPKSAMSRSLIDWLNTAIDTGWVRDGRAVVRGDLDDWPFIATGGAPPPGVFDARATLEDMRVRFHADWPDATDMDARITFVDNGFEVAGSARLGEVRIGEFVAGIDNFREGVLHIDARGDDDARRMVGVLRQSPLQRDYGKALASLQANGPASAVVALRLGLHDVDDARKRIVGSVQLRGVRLAESEWKLAFTGVTGALRYDQNGFTADGLQAQYDRQQGRLSLRAGAGHVRDPAQGFEAELEATIGAEDLLARVPDLDWLRPQVSGRARWVAGVAIPAAGASGPAGGAAPGPSRLSLRSDLVGMSLALPAPMRKPAAQALPTTVELALPLDTGEIALAFGQRLALRARERAGGMGMRVVFGQSRVAEPPPASGLVLTGRTPVLEAIEWVTLLRGGNGSRDGGGLPLRQVDVRADSLRMLGASFADTRLQLQPVPGGLAARFDGPALAGSLQIPDAAEAEIAGRLQRLHWRPEQPTSAAAAASPMVAVPTVGAAAGALPVMPGLRVDPSTAASAEVDPARVPSLALDIDDLRVLDARLGQAVFRSRPTPGAMEILRLQTRADGRSLDLSGRWSGGAGGRTALDATLVSEDFGALFTEVGIGGMIAEGHGTARFQAAWPGSPMQFRLPALEGQLRLDIKDGRLAEVEPGGTGRVLGLLSLAQLPRRLLLDFRDFFSKGFAFNKLGGTVRFVDGDARSDDFDIDGPAAAIAIRGSADLRAQTFNQTIEVRPKAGNLLTAVGAIAGGPVGAAVGAVANAVLQKPIGEMTAKNYRVTGPWKDPKVDVIERQAPSRGAPARIEPPPTRPARTPPSASG